MKPLSGDKQLGVASPLKCAAIQSGKTNHPSMDKNEVGLDVSHHIHLFLEGRGKYFFLDILFHRIKLPPSICDGWHIYMFASLHFGKCTRTARARHVSTI